MTSVQDTDTTPTEGELVFDPTDPGFRADPYPTYRRLRAAGPVHRGFLGLRTVVRYEECAALLRDPRLGKDFRKSKFYDVVMAASDGNPPPFLGFGVEGGATPFVLTDPPEHTRLRALVGAPFTPSLVRGMTGWVERTVDELLDAVPDEFDLVPALADPLPVRLLGKLLAVPEQDFAQFTEWNHEMAGVLDLDLNIPPEIAARRRSAIAECTGYFLELANRRVTAPGDDLVSGLVHAREGDDGLTPHEVAATCALLMTAAAETTANLVASGVLVFSRHPDAYARLVADPGLAAGAVEEMLRYEPPAQETGRIALEDIRIGDAVIEAGEPILVMMGCANRDERRFPDGDRFVIDRNDKGHLAFGLGIHYCLGAPLARLMAETVFRAVAHRFPAIEVTVPSPRYKDGFGLRGPAELPVAVTRR